MCSHGIYYTFGQAIAQTERTFVVGNSISVETDIVSLTKGINTVV